MALINYSKKPVAWTGKVEWRNPQFWRGEVETKATCVYSPHRKDIEAAYKDAGIPTYGEYDDVKTLRRQEKEQCDEQTESADSTDDGERGSDFDSSTVVSESGGSEDGLVPKDWENLPWPAMRSLACSLTDEPIKNKNDAIRVIKSAAGQV